MIVSTVYYKLNPVITTSFLRIALPDIAERHVCGCRNGNFHGITSRFYHLNGLNLCLRV